MGFHLPLARIDQDAARAILERNVLNSQRLIAGDFETVLSDIIQQLEEPPLSNAVPLSTIELTKRIGHALREGLIGLAPNGFEFCQWLWDVAPLHIVRLGTRPMSVEMHAAGVLQLRKLAAVVLHLYIEEQPQRLESVIPLLDSSVDWVDARQLIFYAMLDHYLTRFELDYQHLLALARDTRSWRALVPFEAGKEILAEQSDFTGMVLAFLSASRHLHGHEEILPSLTLFMRSVIRYGEPDAIIRYFSVHETDASPALMEATAMALIRNRVPHADEFRDAFRRILVGWQPAQSGELEGLLCRATEILDVSAPL